MRTLLSFELHLARDYIAACMPDFTIPAYSDLILQHSKRGAFEALANAIANSKSTPVVAQAVRSPVLNRDLCDNSFVEGQFKLCFQNIQGLRSKSAIFQQILNFQHFDILALIETHALVLPSTLEDVARKSGYHVIFLKGQQGHFKGRASGGIIVFVKKCWRITSITKEYTEYGERVSWFIGEY